MHLGPFRYRLFTALLLSGTISNIGSFIHIMAAAWLMTELTPSALLVALISTASFLPLFLCALPAGVIADITDRRILLTVTQSIMFLTVLLLTILVYTHHIHPWTLVILTFILGIAGGLNAPAWTTAIADMVQISDLPAAMTLNSMGFNIARAVGPALGGTIIGTLGLGAPFLFDTLSYLGVLAVLIYWSYQPRKQIISKTSLRRSMITGLKFVLNTRDILKISIHSGIFFFAGSGIWTLLPLIARQKIHTDALGYGVLFGTLGLGAIISGLILLIFRHKWPLDKLLFVTIVLYIIATLGLAVVHHYLPACILCFIAGVAWLAIASSYNITVLMLTPAELKSRVFAICMAVTSGSMALGSYLFGKIADYLGSDIGLSIAGLWLICMLSLFWWLKKKNGFSLEARIL